MKKYTDFQTDNILESYSTNNTRCFKPLNCNSGIFKNSFFSLKTVVNWNHLEEDVVNAKSLDCFRAAVHRRD